MPGDERASIRQYPSETGAGENAYSTTVDQQVSGMTYKHLKPGYRIALHGSFYAQD
jgi:hypothetical protein